MERPRPFGQRVAELRERWTDARRVAHYGQLRDRESQLEVVALIYEWLAEATAEIQHVYGEQIEVQLSQIESGGGAATGFTVVMGDGVGFVCFVEPVGNHDDQWQVAIATRTSRHVSWTSVRAERPGWTRGRIEDLVLDLLAAFERSRSRSQGLDSSSPTDESTRGGTHVSDRTRRPLPRKRFAKLPADVEPMSDA